MIWSRFIGYLVVINSYQLDAETAKSHAVRGFSVPNFSSFISRSVVAEGY